jgi:hypothetical protein
VASARPYAPTVHTIILPSQLPRDLRLNFRDLDELSIVSMMSVALLSIYGLSQNNSNIPDHMNILSSTDALDHVRLYYPLNLDLHLIPILSCGKAPGTNPLCRIKQCCLWELALNYLLSGSSCLEYKDTNV